MFLDTPHLLPSYKCNYKFTMTLNSFQRNIFTQAHNESQVATSQGISLTVDQMYIGIHLQKNSSYEIARLHKSCFSLKNTGNTP